MIQTICDIGDDPAVRASLLILNNASASETSWLDAAGLDRLITGARVATSIGPDAAFMLAFDERADYDSPNFVWFRERFDQFLYVDRVIVAQTHRRQGLARSLYADLFRRAERHGYPRIACEVNSRPPNPVSDAFHAKLGFSEVGSGAVGAKSVRYLLCETDKSGARTGDGI